jgi:hypothetical protein
MHFSLSKWTAKEA